MSGAGIVGHSLRIKKKEWNESPPYTMTQNHDRRIKVLKLLETNIKISLGMEGLLERHMREKTEKFDYLKITPVHFTRGWKGKL